MGPQPKTDKAIRFLLLLSVVFTALAHGAVEPWSVAIFELIVIAIIWVWAAKALIERRVQIVVPAAALPIGFLTLLGLVQWLAPRRWGLSMDLEATRSAALMLFTLLVCFLVGANFLVSKESMNGLVRFLVIYGLAMAVFALIQHFTWDGRFYWLRPTKRGAVFGPFVNRNHFAGYMEMIIPLPIAMIITGGAGKEWRAFYGFAAAFMGLALVISLSRGGMLSLFASMGFIFLVALRRAARASQGQPRWFLSGLVIIAIVAAIVAGVIWIGAEPVINRAAQTIIEAANPGDSMGRRLIWKDTLSMIKANVATGVGLGAYETAYPIYDSSGGDLLVTASHNDYLQVLADCGLLGGVAAIWFIVVVIRSALRGAMSESPLVAALAMGSGAGIFAMLIHSLFDFNLQLPSNALLFLLLVAVASWASDAAPCRQ
jgi:O-antigen ligase